MTRRILFCTIGTSPAVVTETVWALKETWRPDEIHIVTTSAGVHKETESGGRPLLSVTKELQHPEGRLKGLLQSYPKVVVYVPRDQETGPIWHEIGPFISRDEAVVAAIQLAERGDALADVATPRDALLMGRVIYKLMAGFVRSRETEVHMSLAGGRKTMSAHALMSFSMLARPGADRASHVLVSDGFEHGEFWHPDQGGTIKGRNGPLDPKDAEVSLVDTPAPLMRDYYSENEMSRLEQLDLISVVDRLRVGDMFSRSPEIRLDIARNVVAIHGREAALEPALFATLRLILQARKEAWPGAGPNEEGENQKGWLTYGQIALAKTQFSSGDSILRLWTSIRTEAADRGFAGPGMSERDTQSLSSRLAAQKKCYEANDRTSRHDAVEELVTAVEEDFAPNISDLRSVLDAEFGQRIAKVILPRNQGQRTRGPLIAHGFEDYVCARIRFGSLIRPEKIWFE